MMSLFTETLLKYFFLITPFFALSMFLANAQVSGIGTMRRSMTKLMAENLVYRHNDEYKFFNPFFAQWLKSKNRR